MFSQHAEGINLDLINSLGARLRTFAPIAEGSKALVVSAFWPCLPGTSANKKREHSLSSGQRVGTIDRGYQSSLSRCSNPSIEVVS